MGWALPNPSTRIFLSTPSARRATISLLDRASFAIFLSTPSVRRATFLQVHFYQS